MSTRTTTRTTTRTSTGPRRAAANPANPFVQRARSRRLRRWAVAAATVLLLAGLAWLVLGSSVLAVRQFQVVGTDRVPVADVLRAAAAERGRPMLLVDLTAVSRRINALPLVHDVRVVRQWPGTLVVTVHERVAVVAVPSAGAQAADPATPRTVRLVDRDGVQVGVGPRPAGLPYLQVDVDRAGPDTLRAALDVLAALPPDLRSGLKGIGAQTPDGVWLVLSSGIRVVWGDATDGDRKAAALHAVVTVSDPAKVVQVDVSAPDAPAVTNRR